jgi:hypothetical protein
MKSRYHPVLAKRLNRKTMGSTTIDGASPAKTGPGVVINLSFRGSDGRVTTRPRSGR